MNSSAKNGEITRETLQIREGRRELIRISLIRLSLLSPPNLLPRSTQLKPSTLRPSLRPISFPTYYISPDAHPFSVHVGRRHVTRSGPIGLARGRVAGGRGRGSARLRIFLHLARGRSMYRAFLATNYIFSTVMATCVRSVCVYVCVCRTIPLHCDSGVRRVRCIRLSLKILEKLCLGTRARFSKC